MSVENPFPTDKEERRQLVWRCFHHEIGELRKSLPAADMARVDDVMVQIMETIEELIDDYISFDELPCGCDTAEHWHPPYQVHIGSMLCQAIEEQLPDLRLWVTLVPPEIYAYLGIDPDNRTPEDSARVEAFIQEQIHRVMELFQRLADEQTQREQELEEERIAIADSVERDFLDMLFDAQRKRRERLEREESA